MSTATTGMRYHPLTLIAFLLANRGLFVQTITFNRDSGFEYQLSLFHCLQPVCAIEMTPWKKKRQVWILLQEVAELSVPTAQTCRYHKLNF